MSTTDPEPTVLDIRDVSIRYRRRGESPQAAVKGASLRVGAGEIVGLAGESGSGKSTLALAAMGSTYLSGSFSQGEVLLEGVNLVGMKSREKRSIWGVKIAHVPQNAATALHPSITIEKQISEPLRRHLDLGRSEQNHRVSRLLEEVRIADVPSSLAKYPHELSGGQQQRVALAIAIACSPRVLVLDEPTTGLDVTTQASITKLLRDLADTQGIGMIIVSHDLAMLSSLSDRLSIMYAGEIVESGPTWGVIAEPRHPYTLALKTATPDVSRLYMPVGLNGLAPRQPMPDCCTFQPRCSFANGRCSRSHPELEYVTDGHKVRCFNWNDLTYPELGGEPHITKQNGAASEPVMQVTDLVCRYKGEARSACDQISFELAPSEKLGIVGESGSGKSTLLKAIAGLHIPTDGKIRFREEELASEVGGRTDVQRQAIQLVFQNPDASLNPRHSVRKIIGRSIRLFRSPESRSNEELGVREALDSVRLSGDVANRYPGELSGGEKQRVAIARAVAAKPSLLLLDEVTSALDVSVQASVLSLLAEVADTFQISLIFVSHDLAVVGSLCDRVLVVRNGEICERGPAGSILSMPRHPYTRALVGSIPRFNNPVDPSV